MTVNNLFRPHSSRTLMYAVAVAIAAAWTVAADAQPFYADSTLRLQVSPKETQVYIDGYYSGTVDDFDGFFQGLHLEPGEHDATFYLDGYRTVSQKIQLEPHGTFRIKHTMEPLATGEKAEPKPVAAPRPTDGTARRPERVGPPEPGGPGGPRSRAGGADSSFGSISVRVQPGNAEVLIDGERWEGTAADNRLMVQLGPGSHHVEIRREGYRSYSSDIDVRAGETTTLNVSLSRQ